jgi:hypothetical protein
MASLKHCREMNVRSTIAAGRPKVKPNPFAADAYQQCRCTQQRPCSHQR